jgi:hypothetical protein
MASEIASQVESQRSMSPSGTTSLPGTQAITKVAQEARIKHKRSRQEKTVPVSIRFD